MEVTPVYLGGQSGNSFFVDYIGAETGQLEANGSGFRWESDQPATAVTVFSTNTVGLLNNYSIGFQEVNAVPEPSSLALLLLTSGLFLTRRRQS